MSGRRLLAVLGLVPFALRCTSVAQITTLSDPACRTTVSAALAKIFESEGESAGVAEELAESTAAGLETWGLGPRPFLVASPSGVDYSFFVERKGDVEIARLRTVELGDVTGNGVAVTQGVASGERVVVTGASLLVDGDPVRIIP